ncbi:MAG: hypothetical protein M1608_08260, partial [Candidatus Omnitrophica bacterium]|nr:hypothetical protein [Candidatus Omnitrophota bacterium]
MRESFTIRQQFAWLGILSAFWIFLGLIFAMQMVFSGFATWNHAFWISFRDWYPWVLLSPLVLWIAWRFPIESGHWHRSVPVHLLGCALVVVGYGVLARLIDPGPNPFRGRPMLSVERRLMLDPPPPDNRPHSDGQLRRPPPEWPPRGPFPPSGSRLEPEWFSLRELFMRANFSIPICCFIV